MRPFLLISVALLLSACGQPDAARLVATPLPYPVPTLQAYPVATIDEYPIPLSEEEIARLQVTNLPPCPEPTTTPVATITPLPTWTPAPPGTLPPTPFPLPSPAPFPGDFVLSLSACVVQGSAPQRVLFSATLTGGPDNSYELYCTSTSWEFGDGQGIISSPMCVPWSPEARVPRVLTMDYSYEHAGTYQARLRVGGQAGGLTSNDVTVEVR